MKCTDMIRDAVKTSMHCMAGYLGNDSLSCAIVFKEEVIGLDEELAGVFLFPSCPLLSQNDRTI